MARRRRRLKLSSAFRFKPFSRKQKQILTWWTKDSPVKDKAGIIADGSVRSGKTLSMSLSYVIWAMETFNGQNLGMAGKTIGSFRRNVLNLLKVMLLLRGYRYRDKRSDNLLEVRKGKIVNYFYIFGGKDESSQDLIQGITLAGMFFDEVALMPESFVNQAIARLSVTGSKQWFNCNPQGPYHFVKVEWIDKADEKNLIHLHLTMDDNLTLSDEVRERFQTAFTGVFYQRYILGLWVAAEGIIYDMFDATKHVYDKVISFMRNDAYISIDYGTQNATVFLLWRKDRKGVWNCTKEYYYSGRERKKQKTDKEFADDLIDFAKGYNILEVIVDPSAASFIAEVRQRNFRVKKAKNDVLDGIRLVGTALNKGLIKFHASCKHTIKEFQSYTWDEKAVERGEDKPNKEHDHAMDAVRYFVFTIMDAPIATVRRKSDFGIRG